MNSPIRFPTAALAFAAGCMIGSEAFAQDIVEQARQRHENYDTTLSDYRSQLNTLVSIGLVTDRLAPAQLIVASELASDVAWDRRDGLQVRMLGQRYVTALELQRGDDMDLGLDFSEPWFVATVPGDSLRVLGALELPGRAAVHPFSAGAPDYYEYELGDTIILSIPQRDIQLVEVRVTPTRGDEALVVGSLWVDSSTGDIAAMQIRFVGKPLWADEDNPRGSAWANRILSLSATIEQGLWEQRYWLPRRQEVELNVDIPFFGDLAFPLVFTNNFGRYNINTGERIAWITEDSLLDAKWVKESEEQFIEIGYDDGEARQSRRVRHGSYQGTDWEIIRPPDDSLNAYASWSEPLEAPSGSLRLPSAEELERRAQELDPGIVGRKMFVIGEVDRLPELIRYNRVEALGLGLGFRADLPRRPFWAVAGAVGFGTGDLELKGRLGLRYDAPSSEFHLDGFSELHTAGSALTDDRRSYRHFMRAFFLGRDDADYYRASGGSLLAGRRWGSFRGRIGVAFEDHRSVVSNTDVALTGIWEDSVFPPNPEAAEDQFWRGDVEGTFFVGDWSRPTNRGELSFGAEVGTDADSLDYFQPRIDFEGRFDVADLAAIALIARSGWTAGDAPAQREWRIGGLETVRGYTHGTRRGDSYWSATLELSRHRQFMQLITPVIFGDVGWAGDTDDWPSGGTSGDVLWSAGVGASFFNGILRTDLVFKESGNPWFEFYFGGAL